MPSNHIEQYLRSSGWDPFRRIPTQKMKRLLEKEGYIVSKAVLSFLASFGNLIIEFPKPPIKDTFDYLDFNIEKVVGEVSHDWIIEDYSAKTGSPLCLIGQGFMNHMNFSMNSEGKVYAGFDDSLYFVANSGLEAIDALCTSLKFNKIE